MKKSLLIFIAIITFSFTHSQEWESIGEQDGKEIYVRPHTSTSAWVKTLNDVVPIDFDKYGMDKTENGKSVFLFKFDCLKGKLGVIAFMYYSDEGEVLYSKQYKEVLTKMEYPFPDTVEEFYLKTFCESE